MNSTVDYLNNPWKPATQQVFKDEQLGKLVDKLGYTAKNLISTEQLEALRSLYESKHDIQQTDGGMFYSVYSRNLDYRKKIHDEIGAILQESLDAHFKDFRVVINSFVVKAPGKKSEFYLHQDTTGLDEWKYSPLNLWIPLTDVTERNGCLSVVPKSHGFFSPYRSISFPAPFDNIGQTVRKYLEPIRMKAGEVLVFDNRLVHNSSANNSDQVRVAIVCGILPMEAKLTTCFKPTYTLGGKVEMIEHEDDFLLKHPNFLFDCQARPETGRSLGWKDDNYHEITDEVFETLCASNGVAITEQEAQPMGECNLISEPVQ